MKQILIAAILGLSLSASLADAATPRNIDDLMVQAIDRNGRTPAAIPAPLALAGYEVLVVIDPTRSTSMALLQLLQRTDYDGSGVVFIVIGDGDLAPLIAALPEAMPQARWVRADSRRTLSLLDLAGTPLLLGLDPGGRVRWQRAGVPERIETWMDAIRDWTGRVRVELDQEQQP